MTRNYIDFDKINAWALTSAQAILRQWLPDGRIEGYEYVARNPRRADRTVGSFKISLRTGAWADFATSDKGGDLISLAAYLADCSQVEAARNLVRMLGITDDG